MFTKEKIKLLEEILLIQSCSKQESQMIEFLKKFFIKNNIFFKQDETGNLIAQNFAVGSQASVNAFCCHLDTVHAIVKDYKVTKKIVKDDIIYSSKSGIGGDDKNGIFICLLMLLEKKPVKTYFFLSEEIGCVGSGEAKKEDFQNINFLIEIDRKGNSDFINFISDKTTTKEFDDFVATYLKKYSYKETSGLTTDIDELLINKAVNVACCNVSSGYYNPHTKDEYISTKDVFNCYSFLLEIHKNNDKQFIRETDYFDFYDDYSSLFLREINLFYKSKQFCQHCYSQLQTDEKEKFFSCPVCGTIYEKNENWSF